MPPYPDIDPLQSTRYQLGNNVRFAATPPNARPHRVASRPPTAKLRFSRLGAWCAPGAGLPGRPHSPERVAHRDPHRPPAGRLLCVIEPQTGLSRWITISAGGRIAAQQ